MSCMWLMQGNGVFTIRQTHVKHMFGTSCIPVGKLVSDK
jgi:hypothetical protein